MARSSSTEAISLRLSWLSRVVGTATATAATIGMFAPAVLLTVLATPLLLRYGRSRRLRGFIRGITVTVVGVLVGTTARAGNVLKVRPPLAFTDEHVPIFVAALVAVLDEM